MDSWVLIYAGLAAILLELFLGAGTGFDLFLVGAALLLGGTVGHLSANWQLGAFVALVLMFTYVLFGRKILKAKLQTGVKHTNVDALIGKTAIITKSGQAKLDGETWRIDSDHQLEVGDRVKIVSVEGVTLKVVKSS